MRRSAGAIAALLLCMGAPACSERDAGRSAAATERLIPRAELFGEAPRSRPALSPLGRRVAFLAPVGGALNVFVAEPGAIGQARAATHEAGGVSDFVWAESGLHILYFTAGADGARRLHAANIDTGETRALTPEGARANIVAASPGEPNIVLVALGERDPAWPDLFRIDIATGARTLIDRNTRRIGQYVADRANRLRLGLRARADGGVDMLARDTRDRWIEAPLFSAPFEDAPQLRILSFESDGRHFLMLDSTNRERAALLRVDVESGERTVLGESARADVTDVWMHPLTRAPEAFASEYLRREWRALEPAAQTDIDFLTQNLRGEPRVVSRARDDRRWLIREEGPQLPPGYWLYERPEAGERRLTPLFRERPALEARALQPMAPAEIVSRDGRTLVSYLTLPPGADGNADGRPDRPVSLVLVVHDGPWARDSYGFNIVHQWLANRGYAALSVNYRGSAGFGRAFLNAGNRQWGAAMQSDLVDAANWAIDQHITQEGRVALIGEGYGGYAALMGLALAPNAFVCAVSAMGPLDLSAWVSAAPAFLEPLRAQLLQRIGDAGAALRARSPIARARSIHGPVLIAQGGRDPRMPRAEADAFAAALRARNTPHAVLYYPDEAGALARAPNRLSFFTAAEQFLADRQCLGGMAQGMSGEDFAGSRAQLIAGGARIEDLARFAPAPRMARAARARSSNAATHGPRADQLIEDMQLQRDVPIATSPRARAAAPRPPSPQRPAEPVAEPADSD